MQEVHVVSERQGVGRDMAIMAANSDRAARARGVRAVGASKAPPRDVRTFVLDQVK